MCPRPLITRILHSEKNWFSSISSDTIPKVKCAPTFLSLGQPCNYKSKKSARVIAAPTCLQEVSCFRVNCPIDFFSLFSLKWTERKNPVFRRQIPPSGLGTQYSWYFCLKLIFLRLCSWSYVRRSRWESRVAFGIRGEEPCNAPKSMAECWDGQNRFWLSDLIRNFLARRLNQ